MTAQAVAPSVDGPALDALRRRLADPSLQDDLANSASNAIDVESAVAANPRARTLWLDGLVVTAIIAVISGVFLLAAGWQGVAGTEDLQVQVSFAVSGGLGGLAMLAIGFAFLTVHADRYVTATVARAWAELGEEWLALGEAVRALDTALDTGLDTATSEEGS